MENADACCAGHDRSVRQIDVDQYKYGFETEIEMDKAPKGLSEDIIRFISAKKNEPAWMLEWRLEAYRRWLTMDRADLGACRLSEDRFPGHLLLRGAEEHARSEVARRRRSRTAEPMRSSAFRCASRSRCPEGVGVEGERYKSASPSTPCSIRCPSSPRSRRS
jgi:hypothetical protein